MSLVFVGVVTLGEGMHSGGAPALSCLHVPSQHPSSATGSSLLFPRAISGPPLRGSVLFPETWGRCVVQGGEQGIIVDTARGTRRRANDNQRSERPRPRLAREPQKIPSPSLVGLGPGLRSWRTASTTVVVVVVVLGLTTRGSTTRWAQDGVGVSSRTNEVTGGRRGFWSGGVKVGYLYPGLVVAVTESPPGGGEI